MLKINSNDVAHSWWIPKLGGKFDARPAATPTRPGSRPPRTGIFEGQCAEFCGANHAFMTAKVTVVEPAGYELWVEHQKRLIAEAPEAGAGAAQGDRSAEPRRVTGRQ